MPPTDEDVREWEALADANYKPKTVREDWEMPPARPCVICGKATYPEAYLDLDGWILSMTCRDACDPDPIDWPYEEDGARGRDFRALGFTVP